MHQIRNSLKYVARKDYPAMTADLKPIYRPEIEAGATLALDASEEVWVKCGPVLAPELDGTGDVFPLSPALRQILYTTNLMEDFNRPQRKVTQSKTQFPNDDAFVKMLSMAIR